MALDFSRPLSWERLKSPVREQVSSPVISLTPGEALRSICFCCWVFFLESGRSHDLGASACRLLVSRPWLLACCCSWLPSAFRIPACTFHLCSPGLFCSIC